MSSSPLPLSFLLLFQAILSSSRRLYLKVIVAIPGLYLLSFEHAAPIPIKFGRKTWTYVCLGIIFNKKPGISFKYFILVYTPSNK